MAFACQRTTRSVSPTEAGERLLQAVGHHFEDIEAELERLTELRDKPAGTVRVTTGDHAAETILGPKLAELLPRYPDVKVEICVDAGLVDIVAGRFDAGVQGKTSCAGHDRITDRPGYAYGTGRRTCLFADAAHRKRRRSFQSTIASTCASLPWAGCMHGNSKKAAVNFGSV